MYLISLRIFWYFNLNKNIFFSVWTCGKILLMCSTEKITYRFRTTWRWVNSSFDTGIKSACGISQQCTHTFTDLPHDLQANDLGLHQTRSTSICYVRSNSGPLWMIKTFSDEIGFVVFPGTDGTRLLFWAALARKGTSHVISSLWSLYLNPDGTDWAMCSKVSTLVFGPATENCWQKFKLSCHFISINLNFAYATPLDQEFL